MGRRFKKLKWKLAVNNARLKYKGEDEGDARLAVSFIVQNNSSLNNDI